MTALRGRSRPWSVALALGTLVFFASIRPTAADLSKKEWAALLEQAAQKLRDNDMYALGEVLKSMSAEDSARSVTTITKIIDKAGGDPGLVESVREGFSKQSNKEALKAQQKACSSAKAPRLRVLLVQLANGRGTPQDTEAVIKAVADSDPVVATNAIRALCAKRVEAAIEPMIARMEKLDKTMDPPWEELKFSLGELFGRKLGEGADYRSWWESLKSRGGLSAVTDEDRAEYEKERERPTTGGGGKMTSAVRLFGTEIECTRIVFILDISGSMLTIDPGDGDSDPGPVSSAPRGDPSEDKPKEDPDTRMARARRELIRVIKALPATTHVNIIAYSSTVALWKSDGLVKLDAKAKTDAVSFIEKMVAQGVTATDEALRAGLKVKGARCLYLLSDGKPSMGPGADIDPSTIYKLVDEDNKISQMRIFTLGFRGADQSFMRELAKRTGGTYADIR